MKKPRIAVLSRMMALGILVLCTLTVTPVLAQNATNRQAVNSVWLETLDLSKMSTGYGTPQPGKSIDGNPIKLAGMIYPHGIGIHAISSLYIDLHGDATSFTAMVGVDDEKGTLGSVKFVVKVDGKTVARTPVLHGGDAPQHLSVDLRGAQKLLLEVHDGGDGITNDHADWAGAQITLSELASTKPESIPLPPPVVDPPRLIISPPQPGPALQGPRVVGATPGRPFLFLIPATGDAPITFAATNLPAGLSLDPATGLITGSLAQAGRTEVRLTARNAKGIDSRGLTIIGGDHKVAQTPPMGWNSWDAFTRDVDDKKTRASADAMIATGLAAHGYHYIGIDDTWEAGRDADGRIQTNQKFPDMKALADYIHAKGLQFGIYSSPGPKTCGGFEGSYQHEDQDAQTYADWGVDYLKYDWCSYADIAGKNPSLDLMQKPYAVMRASLDKTNRDILFSILPIRHG